MDFRGYILFILEAFFAFFLLYRTGYMNGRRQIFICSSLLFFAFGIRVALLDYETLDYQWFLTKWVDYFRDNGGFGALAQSVGNYNIPYLYFIALFSYSSIKDIYLIKFLSIFFDILLSYACMKLVICAGGSQKRGLICFFLVFLLPTVIINGSMWAQCDSIYTSLAFLSVAVALDDASSGKKVAPILSMTLLALSFGFKLQAVFIMPIFPIIWVWKKYNWLSFLVFPLTYFLLILPAVILGKPLCEAVMLYVDQASTVGDALNYNSPSMTALLHSVNDPVRSSSLCIIFAFAAMFLVFVVGMVFRKRITGQSMTALTLLMVLLIPFLLPHMHDRYFFFADCLTVVFTCLYVSPWEITLRALSALLMQFGSLICYLAYLKTYYLRIGKVFLTNSTGAVAVLITVFIVIFFLVIDLKRADNHVI